MMEQKRNHLSKILWRLLMVATITVLLCGSAFAMEGTGTEADPYIITTAEDLAAVHDDLDGHYVLGNDIDLSGYDHTPIGNEAEGAFTGSFDGKGFTISNLTVKEATKYVGLFGYLEGTVKNVVLDAVEIEGTRYIGGVVGYATQTSIISDCEVLSGNILCRNNLMNLCMGGIIGRTEGSVLGEFTNHANIDFQTESNTINYLGGVVGYSSNTTIFRNCINFGNIASSGYYDDNYIGGIIGYSYDATEYSNCVNYGSIDSQCSYSYSNNYIGGITGYSYRASEFNTCINSGNITSRSESGRIGGIASYIDHETEFNNCTNSGNIVCSCSYGYTGGIVGYAKETTNINKCENSGNLSGSETNTNYYGGIIGYGNENIIRIDLCKNSGEISGVFTCSGGILGQGYRTSEIISNCKNTGFAGKPIGTYSNWSNGSATATDCVNIATVESFETGSGCICVDDSNQVVRTSSYMVRHYVHNFTIYTGNSTYYCSDIRNTATTTNGKSLAEMKDPSLYKLPDGWVIESGKNSGLPYPLNFRPYYLNESVLLLTPGETLLLEAEFDVSHWKSFDEAVVVCENGLVKAVAPGATGISAYSKDGEYRGNCIIYVYKPQDKMTIMAETYSLNTGKTVMLTTDLYDKYPDDPQGLIWSSSDPSIATIDANGKVTAVGGGEVTITGYAPLSDISASCTITVTAPITSLSVPSSVTINVGTPTKLSYTVSPNPFTGTLTWKSTDESIATVEEGVVTGHKPGTAIVTATSDTGIERSCTLTVKQPSTGLELSESELTMEVGFTHQLVATLIPENSTDTITWVSSNTSVATVSNGVLTARNAGQTLITATTSSGYKAYCTVTVVKATVLPASITLNQQSWRAKIGEKLQLTATVQPNNATDKTVTWSSSAPEIVSVSSTGVVTAKASGQAVITATTHNGLFAECEVKVAVTSSAAFELGDGRATIGETVEIPVYIHRNPGIAAFTVTLDYNKAVMEPVAVTAGDLLSVGTFETNLSDENRSQLHLTWYDTENLTEDGLAFTITMQIADAAPKGTYNVSLSYETDDICDADKSSVGFAIEPAQIKIVDYLIGDIYADGKVGMKDIVLLCRYINDLESLSGDQLLAADVYYDGNVDVKDLVQLAQILMDQAPVAVRTFGLRAFAAEESDLSGKIKIEASEPDHNGNVKITVSVKESADMAAFRFGLDALTEYLEINNIVQGADLTEGMFQYQCNADGAPVVLWYDSVSRAVDGEIFVIHATVRDGTEFGDYAIDLNWDADDICNEAFSNITMTADAAEVDFAPNLLISDAEMTVEGTDVSIQVDFTSNARSSYSATAVLGFYEDGKMVKTQIMPVEIHGDQAAVNVTADFAFTQCKLFILEDMTTWSPTANAVTIDR